MSLDDYTSVSNLPNRRLYIFTTTSLGGLCPVLFQRPCAIWSHVRVGLWQLSCPRKSRMAGDDFLSDDTSWRFRLTRINHLVLGGRLMMDSLSVWGIDPQGSRRLTFKMTETDGNSEQCKTQIKERLLPFWSIQRKRRFEHIIHNIMSQVIYR